MIDSPSPAGHAHAPRFTTRRLSLVVVALTIIAPFSIDAYLPSLPDIAREFATSDFYMQQTLSLYLLAFATMTLVYGPLSDAFGRRGVVLVSAAVYVASSIGCAFASDAHSLVLLRIAQGLSASGGLVIGRAIIRDSFTGATAQRVMSQVMLMFALAPAIAPIIGGWLHDFWGWRSVFWFLALLGTAVWVWVAMFLPETLPVAERHPGHPRAIAAAYWHALSMPKFMIMILGIAFNFGGMFLYIAGSPFLLYRHLGFDARHFGFLFVPLVTGLMIGAFISGRIAGRYSHEQAVTAGFAIMLLAGAINVVLNALLPPMPITVIGPVALYACGMSLAMPNLTLLSMELLPRNRGLASALQSFLHTGGSAAVAGLLAPALAASVLWFATGSLILCLCGFVCWHISKRMASP